jgi:hypothetical protein
MNRPALVLLLVSLAAGARAARADAPSSAKAAQDRVDAASQAYQLIEKKWESGAATTDSVCAWSERWYQAIVDSGAKGKSLVSAADAFVQRSQAIQALTDQKVKAGIVGTDDALIVTYYLHEAEMYAARVRGK